MQLIKIFKDITGPSYFNIVHRCTKNILIKIENYSFKNFEKIDEIMKGYS